MHLHYTCVHPTPTLLCQVQVTHQDYRLPLCTGAVDLVFTHYCWLVHASVDTGDGEPVAPHRLSCPGYWRLVKDAGLCTDINHMGKCLMIFFH